MDEKQKNECLRCGRCCLANFAAYVTDLDIARWKEQEREDILNILKREHGQWEGGRLVSAKTGGVLQGCPFYFFDGHDFSCAIHETRPMTCRRYEPGSSKLCPQFDQMY